MKYVCSGLFGKKRWSVLFLLTRLSIAKHLEADLGWCQTYYLSRRPQLHLQYDRKATVTYRKVKMLMGIWRCNTRQCERCNWCFPVFDTRWYLLWWSGHIQFDRVPALLLALSSKWWSCFQQTHGLLNSSQAKMMYWLSLSQLMDTFLRLIYTSALNRCSRLWCWYA